MFSLSINLKTDLLTKGLLNGHNDNDGNHNSNAQAHGSVKAKGGLGLDSLLNIGGLLSHNGGGQGVNVNQNQPVQQNHQPRPAVPFNGQKSASSSTNVHNPQPYGSYMNQEAKPIPSHPNQNARIKGEGAFSVQNSVHKPKESHGSPSNTQHAQTNTKSNGKLLGILPLDNALNLKSVIGAEANLLNVLSSKPKAQGENGQDLNPKSLLNIDGIVHGVLGHNNKGSNGGHGSNGGLLGGLTNGLNLRNHINIG